MSIWMFLNFLNQILERCYSARASQRNVVVLEFGSPRPPRSPLLIRDSRHDKQRIFPFSYEVFHLQRWTFRFHGQNVFENYLTHRSRHEWWHKSPHSVLCLFNVEIMSVFRWTCLEYTRLMNGLTGNGSRKRSLRSLWRTRFFAKRMNINLLRTGRFSFILHTNHVMRDNGSPRSRTNWI